MVPGERQSQGTLTDLRSAVCISVSCIGMRRRPKTDEELRADLKIYEAAWKLQAQLEGGLSERARQHAAEIVDESDLRVRAPKGFLPYDTPATGWMADRSQSPGDWRVPPPGTILTRRHGNREIVAKVLKKGFEFESRHYRSLSAIAREVTGTRWNGLLFFGLAERRNV